MNEKSADASTDGLKFRIIRRGVIAAILPAAMLFLPAGSLRYWQAWAFLAVHLGVMAFAFIWLYSRDRSVIQRRLLRNEQNPEQQLVERFGKLIFLVAFPLAGLDYRFGWSRSVIGEVPAWITALALTAFLCCQLLILWVMNVNRFAARIIQVESGQSVASTGPYRFVRHPMYLASTLQSILVPLALGSIVALPAFALFIPLMIFRLLHEEKLLLKQLPGYADYCRRTPRRLIPFAW
jgi:protein-S-isoprenylcysteine O-methyltransferase Ste14